MNRELTLKEAEKIVDDMYQKRWVECGIEDGNTIHMGNLDKLQYTELESASILLLRTEIILQQENKKLKEVIDKAIELNKQVIKDTKEFYRTTKDIIYSGDTLIDIAEQNLKILKEVE